MTIAQCCHHIHKDNIVSAFRTRQWRNRRERERDTERKKERNIYIYIQTHKSAVATEVNDPHVLCSPQQRM
jgi:hypothetical protein